MFLYFYNYIIYKSKQHSTSLWSSTKISENYTIPKNYLFLTMSPSTNTWSGYTENLNIYNEAATITSSLLILLFKMSLIPNPKKCLTILMINLKSNMKNWFISQRCHFASQSTQMRKKNMTTFHQTRWPREKSTYFTTSYDESLQIISTNNIVGNKIDSATSELESTIEMKLDKITTDNTKIFNSFEIKLSALTS